MDATPDLSKQFSGKVAVVTGGTQGLGEACARMFAARGAAGIVVCGRNAEKGEAVAASITEAGTPTRFVQADLTDVGDVRKVVPAADETFGRVDVLVNAAGLTDRGTIWDTSPDLYDKLFAVNCRAPFFLMQDAVKVMKRVGAKGAIVNIISMSSHGGQPFITAYSASKGALLTLTRNVGFQLMRHGIRCNGLNIGWTDTPGEDRIQKTYHGRDEGWLDQAERDLPFGRLIKPEEVARAVAFLTSEESGLMTGSIVDFDQSVLGSYDSPPMPAPLD